MNAQALKRFVEENQRLAAECASLLGQCQRWERECSLYDRDREALMDFGNEADERAKVAEIRVHELEEESRNLSEQLQLYKHKFETQGVHSLSLHVNIVLSECFTVLAYKFNHTRLSYERTSLCINNF